MRWIPRVSLLTLVALPSIALAAEHVAASAPTFSKDIAPIFQAACQDCHRPGTVAPMSLLTYQDARPWAKSIRERVATRNMPPWHLDKSTGVRHFVNDRSLSDAQIEAIVKWVDAGAPQGNPKDLPPARTWPAEEGWQLAKQFGQPDFIVKSDTFKVGAQGKYEWWGPVSDPPINEPRWVRALELRPSSVAGRKVTHHAIARLNQMDDEDARESWMDGGGMLMEWAIGKQFDIFRPNTGKLLLPGARIYWDIHLHASGEAVEDHVELAVYLYPKGVVPKYRTRLTMFRGTSRGWNSLDIPPNSLAETEYTTTLRQAARIESFQPHMHLRGKSMSMEAILPDGTVRMLTNVDNFNFNWMNNYIYSDDDAPLLPKGSRIRIHAVHDNTTANRHNPDPNVRVGYGRATTDEMAHAWVNVTYISDEEYEAWSTKRAPQSSPVGQ